METSVSLILLIGIALEAHFIFILVMEVFVFAVAFPVVGSGDAVLVSLFHDLVGELEQFAEGRILTQGVREFPVLEFLHGLHEIGKVLFSVLHRLTLSLEVLLRYQHSFELSTY